MHFVHVKNSIYSHQKKIKCEKNQNDIDWTYVSCKYDICLSYNMLIIFKCNFFAQQSISISIFFFWICCKNSMIKKIRFDIFDIEITNIMKLNIIRIIIRIYSSHVRNTIALNWKILSNFDNKLTKITWIF